MTDFDLLISNGEIYDGSGAASLRGDIAIKDGLIVAATGQSRAGN
jgi:N-acyl-D-aspartate/D-glutamate deacylase